MYINKETEERFEELLKKAITANVRLLEESKDLPYDQKLSTVCSVGYNIENISKSIR